MKNNSNTFLSIQYRQLRLSARFVKLLLKNVASKNGLRFLVEQELHRLDKIKRLLICKQKI